jgi:hypothetical protein
MAINDDATIQRHAPDPGGLRAAWAVSAARAGSPGIFGDTALGVEAGVPEELRRLLQAKISLSAVPADAGIGLKDTAAEKEATADAFEYGWCYTDHKTGKEIRKNWRTTDYLNDEPYATRVHAMLGQLGLPVPSRDQVFRGTNHDLLFLNSHGVVIRIGPHDVDDLLNPGILQPLGWLEDRENRVDKLPLTVAIYPGVELDSQYNNAAQKPALAGNLYDMLTATQQGTDDINTEGNTGIIRVLDDDGREVAVRLLVDADNRFNGSSARMRKEKKRQIRQQSDSAGTAGIGKGDILLNTLCSVFNAVNNVRYWEKAYEAHQPLRHMFWDAFGGVEAISGLPDVAARDKFWATCAAVTNKPTEITLPVWQIRKDADGKPSYARQELNVPHMVLYRPWTGQEADRIIQPIRQSKDFREAVAEQHAKVCTPAPVNDDPLARLRDFDARGQAFMDGADKNFGQRMASFGRRVWREIRNF